ncbi:Imm26 family immunity protein [Risungbinella massiliensis]|uniref:Imm26 family immunity protein n=1 Tax=Risungbinella massiliensis TaxID=1329796 RepID=UPI0005CB86D7|nr:Imm26 family immunity protein [Risungbinella massiliensis]
MTYIEIYLDSQNARLHIGFMGLELPAYNINYYYISQDLADYFGVINNYEVEDIVKKKRKESSGRWKIELDSESQCFVARSKRAEDLLELAIWILQRTKALKKEEEEEIRTKAINIMNNWIPPKSQRWKVGDIFVIPLQQEKYAFGQVLQDDSYRTVCALFEHCLGEPKLH